ncbi:MAG: FtsX-like permease family protein [Desulfuromonadales bacterium]|nr:FtsX-like permease family protein [Desulfuromonadales bacterium]
MTEQSGGTLCKQALRLVRREMRGGFRGFGVFLTCLFLGVFAISGIGSFTASAREGLLAEAGSLLGGDLEISLHHREIDDQALNLLTALGQVSHVMTMRSMAADLTGERRQLVEVKAVDPAYPLYGSIAIEPTQPLQSVFITAEGPGALVERSLLERLELQLGDRIRLGESVFTLTGIIESEPDRTIRAFNLGPRLMVSHAGLAATGLVRPGSLTEHAYRLRLPDRETVEDVKAELQQSFPGAGWQLRTWREAAPRVRFFLDRLNLNLTLLGLCALLVGGLGVYGAVRGYLHGKIVNIATMKCLGAPTRLVFTAYLLQVLLLGAIGSGCGLLAGAAVPWLLVGLAGDRLPLPLAPALHGEVLLGAALFGLLTALAFSLKPLGTVRRVSPAILFRGYRHAAEQSPGPAVWAAIVLAALALAALALTISSDKRLALWFIGGATVCFGLFRLAAILTVALARRLPRPRHPALRLGLGNLHRRGSSAGNALFSLGLGLTTLVIVIAVQANLNDMVSENVPQQAPAFFLLDLQSHQVERFEALARSLPEVSRVERYPTLRGRIVAIAGRPVEQASIAPEVQWAVRGDRFLSYATQMPEKTEIVAGDWWPADYRGPARISLTADLARGFNVGIGDTLTVNILGRDITAEIASLREVDWSTLELNFAILFAPGTLEDAPQTHLASLHLPEHRQEEVFRVLTRAFPNISVISTREILRNVSRTLEKFGAAFRGMAGIALLSGFLVLGGAVSADQHRRINDAVIFKVCGATRWNILTAFAAEFLLIGLAAGLTSLLVGSLASAGIVKGLLHAPFRLHPGLIITTILLGIGLTLLLGLLGTWKALGQKPAAYLRNE